MLSMQCYSTLIYSYLTGVFSCWLRYLIDYLICNTLTFLVTNYLIILCIWLIPDYELTFYLPDFYCSSTFHYHHIIFLYSISFQHFNIITCSVKSYEKRNIQSTLYKCPPWDRKKSVQLKECAFIVCIYRE